MTTPAVVKIEGDSSHLQAALKASAQAMKAVEAETAAMGKQFEAATAEVGKTADALNTKLSGAKSGGLAATKAEATKLTDMLKQVAKDADLAAGSVVNGLGGVSAIKAAGGISLAVTGVAGALTKFNDAATSAFIRYGEEGKAAADKVNTAFYELTGVFADALVGQENVSQAGDMLAGTWENLKDAATFALAPVKLLSEAFFALTSDADTNTAAIDDNAAALKALQRVQGGNAESASKAAAGLAAATRSANEMLGKTVEVRRQDFEEKQKGLQAALDETKQIAVSKLALEEYNSTLEKMKKSPQGAMALVMGRDENGNLLPEFQDNQMAKAVARVNAQLEDETVLLKALTPEQQKQYQTVKDALRLTFDQVLAEEKHAQAVKDADAAERARNAARRAARVETKSNTDEDSIGTVIESDPSKVAAVATAVHLLEFAWAKADYEKTRYFNSIEYENNKFDAFQAARLAVQQATDKAIVASNDEANRQMNEDLDKRMAATAKATYKSMMLQIGAGETVADAARSAIGGIVTALGDEFMIRSGAAFLNLNPIAGAGFLALAGGAYALAGSLGSKKGPAAETPPTAAPAYEKTENVTYSLRVDAAFADGESIARRFAQMHEGARQRGLIAVPA